MIQLDMASLLVQKEAGTWGLRLPTVTRYLSEKRFVDEFFDAGKLRLSSFGQFRKHPDEQRGDLNEGRIHVEETGPNSRSVTVAILDGENYVLSTCAIENPAMDASFDTRFGFQILDPLAFAVAIAKSIEGFQRGVQGLCNYAPSTLLRRETNEHFDPRMLDDVERRDGYMESWHLRHAQEALFTKHLRFAHQCEYRFIWTEGGSARPFLDVVCPEARKSCRRLERAQEGQSPTSPAPRS